MNPGFAMNKVENQIFAMNNNTKYFKPMWKIILKHILYE